MKLKKARKVFVYFKSGSIKVFDNITYVMLHADNMLEIMNEEQCKIISYVINLKNIEYYETIFEKGEKEDDADI